MYLEESSKPCPICSTLCLQDQIFPNFMLNALVQKSIAESTSKSNTVLLTPTQRQQYIEANKNIKELGVYAYFLKETKNQKDQDLITLNSEISSLTKDISTIQERISTLSLRNQEIKQKFTTNTTSSSEKHVVPVVNTKDDEVEIASTESTPVRAGKKRNLDDHLVMHKSGFLEEINADIFTPSNMLISKLKDHQKDLQDAYFGNEVKTLVSTLVSNTEDGNKSIASKPDIDERPIGQFQQTLTKICKYNRFKTLASIHFADPFAHNPSSIVSAIEFDKDDQFFATAGVTRKIKIFDYKDVVWDYGGNSRGGSITNNNMVIDDEVENSSSEDDSIDESEYSNEESSSDNAISTFRSTHPANRNTTVRPSAARRSRVDRHEIRGMGSGADGVPRYPVQEISCKSKISCLSWNSYIKTQLVSSDYEGIIQLWDSSNGRNVYNFTEHEKRAWSVDFSVVDPLLFASGGDDTKVKIWSTNMKNSATTINSKANICSVKFNPGVGHQVAFGSADHHIHYYDLRHPLHPIAIFKGHKKAASYVKFINPAQMLSASTDCSLRLWNINVSTNVNGTIKSKSGNTSRFIHTTSFASTTSLNSTKGLIGSSIPILENESLVRSYTGHLNEKNFVGLTVNSDGEYIACGSETNTLHVYHKQLSTPLIIHPFGNSVDAKTGNEIGSEDPTSFVSSVCWKRMEENILVAANSQGRIKVLQMV